MKKFRVITDGHDFKVQKRVFYFFWQTVQRPEDLDNKYFGGDEVFSSMEDANEYINEQTAKEWRVISQ